jgi:2-phospho-L-lactate/phosphoenolpyruvate guanylyltransferase
LTSSLVVTPVREFESSKLRLGSLLTREQRIQLSTALLTRLILAIEKSSTNRLVLVSSVPSEVEILSRLHEKVKVLKEMNYHGGVNSAMSEGLLFARSEFPEGKIIFLPADLPLISPNSLEKAIDLLNKFDLVIAPSEKLDGTNLLAFKTKECPIELHYDDDSFRKHLEEAKSSHSNYLVIHEQEFIHDLDTMEDYSFASVFYNASDFKDFLQKIRAV